MLAFRVSKWAEAEIKTWPIEVKYDLSGIIKKLQRGERLGFPDIRYMGVLCLGCYEIRIRGVGGAYRVFYVIRPPFGILVFHAFRKKSQKTPPQEIDTGRKRLRSLIQELEANEEKK